MNHNPDQVNPWLEPQLIQGLNDDNQKGDCSQMQSFFFSYPLNPYHLLLFDKTVR